MSIDDATPAEWDRVASNNTTVVEERDRIRKKWSRWLITEDDIDGMMEEAHVMVQEEVDTAPLPKDAQERKRIPVYTGFINYFPRAIAAVAKLSLIGGIQHGQTAETLHWDRSKSGDELDAMMRHVLDGDWEQVAWRAMANLEKKLENGDAGKSKNIKKD